MRRPARPCSRNASADAYSLTRTPSSARATQRLSHRQFIVDDANRLVVHRVSRVAPRSLAGPGTQPDFGQRTDRLRRQSCRGMVSSIPTVPARASRSVRAGGRPGATAAAWIILSQLHGTVRPRPRPIPRDRPAIGAPVSTQRDAVLAVTQCHNCSPKCPNLGSLQHADSRIRQNLDDLIREPPARRPSRALSLRLPRTRRRQPVAPGMSSRAPAVLDGSSRRISARSHIVVCKRWLHHLYRSPRIERLCRSRNRPVARRIANITASRSPAPRTSLTLESSLGNGFPRSIRPWSMLSHTKV